ncbi:MAG: hypothetical protein LW698_08375 [Planctomycetaceae bacterium]|nr:hypothetical protein [Planctomycetaceae bacterium]
MVNPSALVWGAVFALLAVSGLWAEEPARAAAEEKAEFLRLSRDDQDRPLSLDTSIVEYGRPPDRQGVVGRPPLRVDLVAAVHLGSQSYYDTLDRLFADYDAVLYELVAPPNARPKPGAKPAGAIGSAQQGLTQILGLEFQLEAVDYAAANFVHADLSPKEFDAAMKKRGESWWSMFMKLMREGAARAEREGRQPGGDVGFGEMFGLLFGSGEARQVKLRRIMAEQFTDMEVLTATFGGEEGSTLITDRNAAALRVLREQMARGRKRIAIFYGAAHMDDFDRRLRADFGLQPRETVWLEAWDLREPTPAASPRR